MARKKTHFFTLAAALLLSLGFSPRLSAATFTVTKTADTNDGTCDSDCSLREAVIAANGAAGLDVVAIPAGLYTLTIVGVGEDLALTGDLDLREAVTISGAGVGSTFVDGNSTDRIFHTPTLITGTVTFQNLTIQNGDSGGDDGGGFYQETTTGNLVIDHCSFEDNIGMNGGALASVTATIITDSSFTNNTAKLDAAGIYISDGSSAMTLQNVLIDGNSAVDDFGGFDIGAASVTMTDVTTTNNTAAGGGFGGGRVLTSLPGILTLTDSHFDNNLAVDNVGGLSVVGSMDVSNSTFDNNILTNTGVGGLRCQDLTAGGSCVVSDSQVLANTVAGALVGGIGGMYLDADTVQLTDTDISGNHGGIGGGATGGLSVSGNATIARVTVTGNDAEDYGGMFGNSDPISMDRCSIDNNQATNIAGGAYFTGANTAVTITRSAITRNRTTIVGGGAAGGIYFDATQPLVLTNVTVSGNSAGAAGTGGGVRYLLFGPNVSTFTNVTFDNNEAADGANIHTTGGTIQMENSIVAEGIGGSNCVAVDITSLGHNIEDTNTCNFIDASDLPNTDPFLTALIDHGGNTLTHSLIVTSPAIDGVPFGGTCPATDQRGVTRPIDGNSDTVSSCDIGALELAVCGDGNVQAVLNEQCDDGNTTSGDGCSASCQNELCGDGVINNVSENCDDGNTTAGDGCSASCQTEFCGDGVTNNNGTETCDDGNVSNTDACLNTCTTASCGDGFVRAGIEGCDDGNADDTDACNNSCISTTCGDGVVQPATEQCDDGNTSNTDACLNICTDAFVGDGFIHSGVEECDDGNALSGDGCSSAGQIEGGAAVPAGFRFSVMGCALIR